MKKLASLERKTIWFEASEVRQGQTSKVGMSFENTNSREVIRLVRCCLEKKESDQKGLLEGHAVACWL